MSELDKAIGVLKDFMSNPDDYFSDKYPHIPMKFYKSVQYAIDNLQQPQLNDNQQIVLEQLCLIYIKQIYKSSLQAVYIFINNGMSDAYLNLDRKEADQVLEVFSKWAQEQEGE